MAAGNFIVYSNALLGVLNGSIDLDTDALRMVLVTDSYTPNQNTHDTWADVSANEATGTGYTASGKLLTASLALASNVVTLDADDQTWTSSTITAKYAVIVRDADGNGTLASTDAVIAYAALDTATSVSSTNADFVVSINASGVFTVTAATS